MKIYILIWTIVILIFGCNNKHTTVTNSGVAISKSENNTTEKRKKLAFKNVSEIVKDESSSTWVKFQDSSASLALHFQPQDYKDTLAVSYSPECWLMFPYKLEKDKIIVYWDKNIDTKYNFEIVKAINKTSDKYVGKPFMILELVNDTTFKVTYPIKELIELVNSSSKDRIFFPNEYVIAQDGFL